MNSGFSRLKGVAVVGAIGAGLFGNAGSARAATQATPFAGKGTTTVSSRILNVTGIGNSWAAPVLIVGSSSVTGSLTTGNGNRITISDTVFGIGDATLTVSTSMILADAFDMAMTLSVDGVMFTNPGGTVDFTSSELTSSDRVDIIPGLDASVQYQFVPDNTVIRALYTLSNTSAGTISTCAMVGGDLGSDQYTTIQYSSDGDRLNEDTDYWFVSSDRAAGVNPVHGDDPVLGFARYGAGATIIPINVFRPEAVYGPDKVKGFYGFAYNMNIPPGETVRVLTYVSLDETLSQAMANGASFSSLTSLSSAGLLAGLTQGELDTVVNYGDYLGAATSSSSCAAATPVSAAAGDSGGSSGGGAMKGVELLVGLLLWLLVRRRLPRIRRD